MKIIRLFLILFCILFVASCGGECKEKIDCPSKECFTRSCLDKKCVYDPIKNCNGNGICEEEYGENKCTYPKDCGACSGKKGKYFSMSCNSDDECIESIISDIVSKKSLSKDYRIGDVEVIMQADYNNPFNIYSDEFDLSFSLVENPTDKQDIIIESVKAVIVKSSTQTILHEMEVNRRLYSKDTNVEIKMPLSFDLSFEDDEEEMEEYITFVVSYSYGEFYKGSIKPESGSSEMKLKEKVILVKPSNERKCPKVCDDGNDCTNDVCSQSTDFVCSYEPKTNCITNGICEDTENKCSAPADCGLCEGNYLTTMELGCVGGACVKSIISPVQAAPIVSDKSTSVNDLRFKFRINSPYDYQSDKILVDVEMTDANANYFVSPFKITKIEVYEDDQLLGELALNIKLEDVNDKVEGIEVPIDISFPFDELEKKLKFKINYEFSKKSGDSITEPFRETYSKTLSDEILFVNTGEFSE